jgi:hypothetical protein
MVIQILVTAGILFFILPNIYISYKKNSLTILGLFFWITFWCIGLILIWFPRIIEFIGGFLGVERSIDALIYISIIYLLYISLEQKIKTNDLSREITLLNRKIALEKIKKEK